MYSLWGRWSKIKPYSMQNRVRKCGMSVAVKQHFKILQYYWTVITDLTSRWKEMKLYSTRYIIYGKYFTYYSIWFVVNEMKSSFTSDYTDYVCVVMESPRTLITSFELFQRSFQMLYTMGNTLCISGTNIY